MNGELRLVFFQKNNQGLPQLFSPTLNTLRDLLVPQAGTAGLFSPNDSITEAGIRTKLTVGPAEDEVITAAVGVSDGIKYSGNDEILAKLTSPRLMLGKPQQTEVLSRLVAGSSRSYDFANPFRVRWHASGSAACASRATPSCF